MSNEMKQPFIHLCFKLLIFLRIASFRHIDIRYVQTGLKCTHTQLYDINEIVRESDQRVFKCFLSRAFFLS